MSSKTGMKKAGSAAKKADWADVKRGAAMPPSDNSDENPSGLVSENYTPPHNIANYPVGADGTNKPHEKVGEEGKMILYKAQDGIRKALDDPKVLEAMDTLEKAGMFDNASILLRAQSPLRKDDDEDEEDDAEKSDDDADAAKSDDDSEEEAAMKSDHRFRKDYVPTPADVSTIVDQRIQRHLAPVTKALEGLQAGITKMMANQGGEPALQKAGFIPAGETGRPETPPADRVPNYSKAAARLHKAVDGESEAGDRLPTPQELVQALRDGAAGLGEGI